MNKYKCTNTKEAIICQTEMEQDPEQGLGERREESKAEGLGGAKPHLLFDGIFEERCL